MIGAAQPRRQLNQCIEHGLQVEGRAADDLEDFRCRCLLFERRGEFARPKLNLLEQPDVFDGDDSLVGEGLDELDLALREWPHDLPRQRKDADRFAVAPKWNAKIGSMVAEPLVFAGKIALVLSASTSAH